MNIKSIALRIDNDLINSGKYFGFILERLVSLYHINYFILYRN